MNSKMDIKADMNKYFPNSIAAKFINKQKHPLALGILWLVIIIVVITLIGIANGSGKYSHPIYKHTLLESCRAHVTSRQKLFLQHGTGETNRQLEPDTYQLLYSPKKNLLTMQLEPRANKMIERAKNGNQLSQIQMTNAEINLISQSRQMNENIHDKKLGIRMSAPDGTLLAFVQNGNVRYSVLPTLHSVK